MKSSDLLTQLRGQYPERRVLQLLGYYSLIAEIPNIEILPYNKIIQIFTELGVSERAAYRAALDLGKAGITTGTPRQQQEQTYDD